MTECPKPHVGHCGHYLMYWLLQIWFFQMNWWQLNFKCHVMIRMNLVITLRNRWHAITTTYYDPVRWRMCASPDPVISLLSLLIIATLVWYEIWELFIIRRIQHVNPCVAYSVFMRSWQNVFKLVIPFPCRCVDELWKEFSLPGKIVNQSKVTMRLLYLS